MKNNKIFLSYRRDDSPGYVSKLEAELESAFGAGRVFRDTQDIPGGTQWKKVIDDNLRAAGAMLLVIGPRWQSIWQERRSAPVDYVALELQAARDLGVPIIPLTLDGVILSHDLDLGPVSWLRESQFYDLSDRQGRWAGDFERLVSLLEGLDGIGSPQRLAVKPKRRVAPALIGLGVSLIAAGAAWWYLSSESESLDVVPTAQPGVSLTEDARSDSRVDPVAPVEQTASRTQQGPAPSVPYDIPNIRGNWRGRDGQVYQLSQDAVGAVTLRSDSHGLLPGQFSAKRPRLFTVDTGTGISGEFAVSATNDKMMGFLIVSGRKEYETLVRVGQ